MSAPGPPTSLLLVDDDEVFRRRLARAFAERGFEVHEAGGAAEAIRRARADSPEWALVDLRMPDGSGLEVVRELAALDPTTRIVVLTGYGSIATAVRAVQLGACDYLTKPVWPEDLERALAGQPGGAPSGAEDWERPSLARHEREYIEYVLAECDGNVSQAARRLGLHRQSLQRKLRKFTPR